jgi:DNA uptake protein ComE-like DNA-binding protein
VGAKRAERIVREMSNGTFSDVENLKRVGLTGKHIEKVTGMFDEKEN